MPESIKQRVNKLADRNDAIELRKLLENALLDLTSLRTQFNQLRTDYNAHVHGGVTAGGVNTSVVTATSATAVPILNLTA